MKGDNPIRAPRTHDGTELEVKHIFLTLQGEGPYAGVPAVFIRLGGCNLACAFCDTEFEDFSVMETGDIAARAKNLAGSAGLAVITGGEPLRQNIAPLCEALIAGGFKVQIETNGTLWRELPEEVEIVCSPKNTGGGYHPVRPDLKRRVGAFKFLVSASNADYHHVPDMGISDDIYVQPMDEGDEQKNAANLALAMEIVKQNGYRLSVQLHKILGIE